MGLVDDHRVAAGGELGDLVQDERELLQGGDDDPRLLADQGLGELGRVPVDVYHHAPDVLELVDGLLELTVEDHPVGDDDHLVEHLAVTVVMQRRQPVRGPGDRVRLPRTSGVLHQIALPGPVLSGVGLQCQHGVPLVEAGEDHDLRRLRRPLAPLGGRSTWMNRARMSIQASRCPDPLPQVRGAVPVWVRRVARPAVVAQVERQESGRLPGQLGRHGHPVRVDGEMDQRTA